MGADLLVYVLPQCKFSRERDTFLKQKVKKLDWAGNYFDDYELEEAKKIMANAIDEYWKLDVRRDIVSIYLDDKWYLITGGMSWGDQPTDASEYFEQLQELWTTLNKFSNEDRQKSRKEKKNGTSRENKDT